MTPSVAFSAEALAELDAAVHTEPSATRILETWCIRHGLSGRMRIMHLGGAAELPPDLAPLLPDVPALRYRHVRMLCDGLAVSEAENWYDPAALTPAMNATLDSTDTPFGRVVTPLRFRRQTIATRRWTTPDGPGLEHRAALYAAGAPAPFSVVIERYGAFGNAKATM